MKKRVLALLIIAVVMSFLLNAEMASAVSCEGVETALIECGDDTSGIGHILGLIIGILSAGIGIVGAIGIVISGVQYITAGGNEEQIRKAKRRILEIVIGLVVYAVAAVILWWLFPGGNFDPSSIPHYEKPESSVDNEASSDNGESNSGESTTPKTHYEAKNKVLIKDQDTYNYWLNVPNNATDGMPLVVFLHGSGERGSSSSVGNLPQTKYIMEPSRGYISISPTLEKDGRWSNRGSQQRLKNLISKIVSEYKIDQKRIYILGFSLGAAGAWQIINDNPDLFAAGVLISGRSGGSDPANFTHTKIYAAAGSSEGSLPKDMGVFVDKINSAGGSAMMTVYPGKNHSGMQNSINYNEIFNWLLKQ